VATCSARALTFGELDDFLVDIRNRRGLTIIHSAGGESGTLITLPGNGRDPKIMKSISSD
jgi:hypothetical protein